MVETEKKYPKYNGKVQIENNGNRADVGKIALWDNLEPTNEKSPLMTGTITIQIPEITAARTYRVAIWKNVTKQESPKQE